MNSDFATPERPDRAPAPRGARVLVVDDRPEKLLTLQAALAPLDAPVVSVRSGGEALRALLVDDFAVILLDVNMPGMDGFETARLIRQRPKNQLTPIIFITTYGDDVHAIQAYSLGAVDFVVAPVIPDVLRCKVGVFLDLFQRSQEVQRQADQLYEQTRRLQALSRASLRIHQAPTLDQTLQAAADAAREVLQCRFAGIILTTSPNGMQGRQIVVSPSGTNPAPELWPDDELPGLFERLTTADSRGGVDPFPLRLMLPSDSTPTRLDGLSAPLVGRGEDRLGVLLVADREGGSSREDDGPLLMQLAQVAATAVENTIYFEAREANRVKDEFLATLSHELRTPLSAILGWTQLLQSHSLNADETAEALEIIERNGRMQHKLVEDLLDISRIVSGKMQLAQRTVSLDAVIRAAADVLQPSAQAKQLTIDLRLNAGEDQIRGDPDRLQQVLWNLLSNAVKFTPEGGQVVVELDSHPTQVRIEVRDSGEGIEPAFLPYVFDRFRQADSSRSRRHGGLGIGLALVRHIVEAHGGVVTAHSEGRGCGTTFAVWLPRQPEPSRPAGTDIERSQEGAPVVDTPERSLERA